MVRQVMGAAIAVLFGLVSAAPSSHAAEITIKREGGTNAVGSRSDVRSDAPTVTQRTLWYGFAVSPNGRGFQSGGGISEADERAAARNECENASGRTCVAISVPESWDVVGLHCRNGSVFNGFVGGSYQGFAKNVALDKARDAGFGGSQCIEVLNY
jgi:hypothetical protein